MNEMLSTIKMMDDSTQSHISNTKTKVAVQIDGVMKRFGDSIALHKVSLKIQEGEFVTLLGPSGCGKTTLLNLIAGFTEADNGEIFIDNQLVTDTPPYQREIGIVFQSYALFPHMNVADNVGFGLRMRGVPKAEIKKQVAHALKLVKLESYDQRRPKELSGGQQQRVALARALVIRPKVLLLDEPFSALDKNLRVAMQQELKDIQRKLGVTTIFVTHDQGEALAMSDRVVVMSGGYVRQVAPPSEIYRKPYDPFVAAFVGDANVLTARYIKNYEEHGIIELCGTQVHLPKSSINAEVNDFVDLYVRPEHIRLVPLGPKSMLSGTVVGQVFQGDHVDVFVNIPDIGLDTPLNVRASGLSALEDWPIGSGVGLELSTNDASAFSRQHKN